MDVIRKGIRIITALLIVVFVNSSFAANFFNVQSSGQNLIINTQVPTHPSLYPSAGIRIPANYSFSPTTNCLLNFATGYCSFPVGNTQPAVIGLVGSPGLINVSLCLLANPYSLEMPISCQNYTVGVGGTPTPPPPSPVRGIFGYVANFDSISKCSIAPDGTLFNCVATLTGLSPFDIELNQDSTLAYVSYLAGSQTGVLKCSVNFVNGDLVNCSPTGNGFNAPLGIDINPTGNYAYIANSNGDITKCSIINGDFVSCSLTGGGVAVAVDITINRAGTFAYITDSTNQQIIKCDVDQTNGDLTNCTFTGPQNVFIPRFIEFNNAGTTAYITTNAVNLSYGVFACTVNQVSGALTNCTDTGGFTAITGGIAFNAAGDLIYITNQSSVTTCGMDTNTPSLLINCTTSGNYFFNPLGPAGIALTGGHS
ncbi:MAG: hypothetical protein H0U70_09390 [Tatlockia sp.]|nr:hypothetical protein [Tatlockia sp.]